MKVNPKVWREKLCVTDWKPTGTSCNFCYPFLPLAFRKDARGTLETILKCDFCPILGTGLKEQLLLLTYFPH